MDRQTSPTTEEQDSQGDFHCLLCEGIIEIAEHDIFFITGYCRHCHAALEEDE